MRLQKGADVEAKETIYPYVHERKTPKELFIYPKVNNVNQCIYQIQSLYISMEERKIHRHEMSSGHLSLSLKNKIEKV